MYKVNITNTDNNEHFTTTGEYYKRECAESSGAFERY